MKPEILFVSCICKQGGSSNIKKQHQSHGPHAQVIQILHTTIQIFLYPGVRFNLKFCTQWVIAFKIKKNGVCAGRQAPGVCVFVCVCVCVCARAQIHTVVFGRLFLVFDYVGAFELGKNWEIIWNLWFNCFFVGVFSVCDVGTWFAGLATVPDGLIAARCVFYYFFYFVYIIFSFV